MQRRDPPHVLVVDDDRSMQRLLADALTRRGYRVTVERDGEWALRTFETKRFDLVILDLLLPALNGYEVARRLRGLPRGRRVPIIVISGVYKNEVNRTEALHKHGAVAFFEKPFRLEELAEAMAKALPHRPPVPPPDRPPPPPIEEDEVTGEGRADAAQREEREHVEAELRRSRLVPAGPTLKGSLRTRPFPELLAEIYRWRATGALLLRRGKVKKIVYFREGTAAFVKSNLLVECLGQVLVREKMISAAECSESLRRAKGSKRLQGTVLVEMGCISPHNLQYGLTLQIQRKLFDAFRWEEGEFQFNPKVPLPAEPISLSMTMAQLIREGVRRTYDRERLELALAGLDEKYVHLASDPLFALQDAGLGDEERQVVELVDGRKKLRTLRGLGLLPALDFDQLLWSLRCAQLLELRDEAAPGRTTWSLARLEPARVASLSLAVPPPLPAAPPTRPPPLPLRAAAPQPAASRADAGPPLKLPWANAPTRSATEPSPDPRSAARASAPAQASPVRATRSTAAGRPTQPWLPELTGGGEPAAPVAFGTQRPSLSFPRTVTSPRRRGSPLIPEVLEPSAPHDSSSEDSVAREGLAERLAQLRRLDYFELLGVHRDANREEIKRAYFGMAKAHHPDHYAQSSSAELRQLAQQIYELLSLAHDTLTDTQERERYARELERGVRPELGENVGNVLAAEGRFQKGEELVRARRYAEAVRFFEDAIALYADEGEFHAWYGWATFLADPRQTELAMERIERAVSLNPKLDKSYLFLGYILKASGRPDRAERQFEKAIQCSPDCTEALRELRLMGQLRR